MKQCPKCNELMDFVGQDTFNDYWQCRYCAKTAKEIRTVKQTQPEPTTAEMLWWLVENGYTIYRYPHKTRVFGYVHNPLTPNYPFSFGKGENYATLEDAVRAAYEKAKEA